MLRKFTVLCAAAVLAGTLVFAQPPGGTGTPPAPPDPATMATLQVNQLTAQLNLTDAQKAQAITIFTNANTSAQPIQANMQTLQQSLATAVKANATATITSVAGQIGTAQGQLTNINGLAQAAFYAILTADQQKIYNVMPMGGPGGRGPGGPGGPGGAGPQMRGNGMRGRPPM